MAQYIWSRQKWVGTVPTHMFYSALRFLEVIAKRHAKLALARRCYRKIAGKSATNARCANLTWDKEELAEVRKAGHHLWRIFFGQVTRIE